MVSINLQVVCLATCNVWTKVVCLGLLFVSLFFSLVTFRPVKVSWSRLFYLSVFTSYFNYLKYSVIFLEVLCRYPSLRDSLRSLDAELRQSDALYIDIYIHFAKSI